MPRSNEEIQVQVRTAILGYTPSEFGGSAQRAVTPFPTPKKLNGFPFFKGDPYMENQLPIVLSSMMNDMENNIILDRFSRTCKTFFNLSEDARELEWRKLMIRKFKILSPHMQETLLSPSVFQKNGCTFSKAYKRCMRLKWAYYFRVSAVAIENEYFFNNHLRAAICLGLVSEVQKILDLRTKLSVHDTIGLHCALLLGDMRMVEMLVGSGKFDPMILGDIPHVNYLIVACNVGNLGFVELLVDRYLELMEENKDRSHSLYLKLKDALRDHEHCHKGRDNYQPIIDYLNRVMNAIEHPRDSESMQCTIL